ncbi:hypothetical protein KO481_28090 [Nocardia sp. NEAU-G5]|uniref:Uncharacterized protein n=1 Tax=Nocardia albiluteola TaxID=2842303 RepID=A0ABS6B4Z8_9NOCA|nr:hypothetical protein [Nocardia albiluteola]
MVETLEVDEFPDDGARPAEGIGIARIRVAAKVSTTYQGRPPVRWTHGINRYAAGNGGSE